MSGIGNVGPRDLSGIINEPSGSESRVTPGEGPRQIPGLPPAIANNPIFARLQSILGFVMPLPPPTVQGTSKESGKGTLSLDKPIDVSRLMLMFQEAQAKTDKDQMASKVTELQHAKTAIKTNVDETLKKISDQLSKLESQKKWGLFGKIFGGIAIALSIVAAVATGGALAIGVAVVSAAVFALEQSGAMKKMFDAMGLSDEAQKWIMVGISAALLVASLGAAGMAMVGQAAAAGAKAVATNVLPRLGSAAQMAGGVVKVGEGATQIGASINAYGIAELESDRKALEAKNLQLKQQQDKMIEELQALMQKMEEGVQAAVQILGSEHESIQQQMRHMKT
ncbi:MAG: type III secretion system translocon subunit SctE [Alphaproteobacteria bacterium]|nr:type III secretion system translocon subunit SctE [Alphaproteobacteria bacterium]